MAGARAQVKALPTAILHSVSRQISYAPKEQLPHMVHSITSDLAVCSSLLAKTWSQKDTKASEEVVAVHRFTTQLSALLQDRAVERRWGGIVLVKAAIEQGGHDILQKNTVWTKNLLHILCKPNPSTIHLLTIFTLTRIFLLTHGHPALVRELATPSLPSFVAACLDILKQNKLKKVSEPLLLLAVLESFDHLVPLHPTIFRSFQSQVRELLRPLIAPTSSEFIPKTYFKTDDIRESAQHLFVQLHQCAPKGIVAEEWQSLLSKTVENAHDTADLVFRSLIEFWKADGRPKPAPITIDTEVQSDASPLQLPGWAGIRPGCERLVHLLRLLKCFFSLPNSSHISCKVGQVLTLVQRIFLLRVPSSEDEKQGAEYLYHTQIAREELMELLNRLPSIHSSVLDLIMTMIDRLGASLLSTMSIDFLSHVARLFETEKKDASLKTASYRLLRVLLDKKGSIVDQYLVKSLSTVMEECSLDCLAFDRGVAIGEKQHTKLKANQEQSFTRAIPKELHQAASALMPILLAKLPTHCVPLHSRAQLDQAAVLTCNREAIAASVLNPRSGSSILPFLARTSAETAGCEAILRPRLPPITIGPGGLDGAYEEISEREKSDEEMDDRSIRNDEVENTEADSASTEDNLGKRKRELEEFRLPARDAVNNDGALSSASEQSASTITTASPEKTDVVLEEAYTPKAKAKSRPSKRVRFSDPEAELLGQPTPSAHVSTPEMQSPAPLPVPTSSGEDTAHGNSESMGEAEEDEDEDAFEIPPLTMEQDTDEEDEG